MRISDWSSDVCSSDLPGTLLKNADTAMYHAKTTGRSNFQWFTSAMLQQTQEKLALSAALRRAIEGNELEIVFQPEILLRDGSIIGMEALTRWHSTQHEIGRAHV